MSFSSVDRPRPLCVTHSTALSVPSPHSSFALLSLSITFPLSFFSSCVQTVSDSVQNGVRGKDTLSDKEHECIVPKKD